MRYLCLISISACAALAQSSTTSEARLPDLNGGYTTPGQSFATSRTATGASRVEYAPSINGRMVPRETVEEKIIRQDASGNRLVERYVRRYDATGNPGPVEKSVIEEKRTGAGSLTTTTTVYRGDLNGNLAPSERSVSQAVTQGPTVITNTTIERSGLDGTLTPAERVQSTLSKTSPQSEQLTVSRLRRDASGNFYEAVREVTDRQTATGGNVTTENRVQYVDGALAEQTVARTVKDAQGGSTTTVDVFAPQAPGLSADITGRLALKEQQQITLQADKASGKVTETVVSRKPAVSDMNRLGPAQVLSQSTCAGGAEACLAAKK